MRSRNIRQDQERSPTRWLLLSATTELLVVNLVPPQHNPQPDSEFARLAQNMSLSSDVRTQ